MKWGKRERGGGGGGEGVNRFLEPQMQSCELELSPASCGDSIKAIKVALQSN